MIEFTSALTSSGNNTEQWVKETGKGYAVQKGTTLADK